MTNRPLHWMSAAELVAAYKAKKLSPVEATQAVLDRIDAINPKINAFCLVDHASALAAARASEARWAKGEPLSVVDGVPTGVKDLILARGWPTRRGSKAADSAGPWNDDAPSVARLREAGAVLVGKTATSEWGWKAVTDSPLNGITRNPWNLEMTPGGSSGGGSAAAAAGLAPLHIGTDAGGSIRIPASFCGLAGIKGHFGRVPAWPNSPMTNVAHIGPIARDVQDCTTLLEVISRPDYRDWMALPHDSSLAVRLQRNVCDGIKGLRIAYSPRLGYIKYVDPEVEAAVERVVSMFARLGATVDQADPGFEDCAELITIHWFASARNRFSKLSPEKFRLLDPGLQQTCEEAAKYTIDDFLDYQQRRISVGEAMNQFNQRYDLLLTPSVMVPAFQVGQVSPKPVPPGITTTPANWSWWTQFSSPFNLTQQPAISVNCGFTESGLPIGLQIVAPAYRDDLALRGAYAFEQARGPVHWPEL